MADDERISGFLTLKPISLGVGFGGASATFFMLIALAGMFGYAPGFITMTAELFKGYRASFLGAIFGAIWGFAFGFAFGYIVAEFHNRVF